MYAVNICDLTKDNILAQFLFAPLLHERRVVRAEKTIDGMAVVIECDDERGAAIVHIVRKKWHRNLLRLYHSKTGKGGWRRV